MERWQIVATCVFITLVVYGLGRFTLHQLLSFLLFHPLVGGDPLILRPGTQDYTVRVRVARQSALQVLYVAATPAARTRTHPTHPIILYSYGNAGNLASRQTELWELSTALQMDIVSYDPRGFGLSTRAKPTADTWLADGQAVYTWLHQRYPHRPIIAWGCSLGGAVAAQLALQSGVVGIVMQTTFARTSDVIQYVLPRPLCFVRFAPLIDWLLPPGYRLRSTEALARAHKPTLVLHARHDELMSLDTAQQLCAVNPPMTTYHEIIGTHNDYSLHEPASLKVIHEFLETIRRTLIVSGRP